MGQQVQTDAEWLYVRGSLEHAAFDTHLMQSQGQTEPTDAATNNDDRYVIRSHRCVPGGSHPGSANATGLAILRPRRRRLAAHQTRSVRPHLQVSKMQHVVSR